MASNTTATENRRKRHHKNEGRRRKAAQSKKSTPSPAEPFAPLGEAGKPAPKAAAAKK